MGNLPDEKVYPLVPYSDSSDEEETYQPQLPPEKQCLDANSDHEGEQDSHQGSIERAISGTPTCVVEKEHSMSRETENDSWEDCSSDDDDEESMFLSSLSRRCWSPVCDSYGRSEWILSPVCDYGRNYGMPGRRVYYVCVKDNPAEESKCCELLKQIGCYGSSFIRMCERDRSKFYAHLRDDEAAKLKRIDGIAAVYLGSDIMIEC